MKGENRQRAKEFARKVHAKYTFINKNLLRNTYEDADVYEKDSLDRLRSEWDIISQAPNYDKPYIKHVKFLSNSWPHLRLLSDFMEVSTSPTRWRKFRQKSPEVDAQKQAAMDADRQERWVRTNVARLDYFRSGVVNHLTIKTSHALEDALRSEERMPDPGVELRLYVVEDLSRDVIELLGSAYDIEPAFFRAHILDFAWHNARDYWRDPPNLDLVAKKQHWTVIRFVRARYFKNVASFRRGFKEAEGFNVLRRPDDDENNRSFWDKRDAKIGLIRSRASFWLKRRGKDGEAAVGVLLLDPTISEGCPLWGGYRNWEEAPGLHNDEKGPTLPPTNPEHKSLFEDFLYWAKKPDVFAALSTTLSPHRTGSTAPGVSSTHVPIQALLHIICAEWLTMADYIKSRLTQIDWEIAYPETFLKYRSRVDVSLKKLHIWRRYVPIFREMLSETLEFVFRFPCRTPSLYGPPMGGDPEGGPLGSVPPPAGVVAAAPPVTASILRLAAGTATTDGTNGDATIHGMTAGGEDENLRPPSPVRQPLQGAGARSSTPGAITVYQRDFTLALSYMEEHQQRIDRLTTVVTAVMSIADTRRALADNKNIGRLTWLATFFVPFSLVAATFSMQADVTTISTETVRWFFAVALPVAAITLGLAVALSHDLVQKYLGIGDGMRGWYGL